MEIKDIRNITVLGTGNMGPGIAFQFARSGYNVTMWGRRPESVRTGINNLEKIIEELLNHSVISANQVRRIMELINVTDDFSKASSEVDFVVEAITEQLELKQEVFSALEDNCQPKAIIASNTSSLLPSDLSMKMKHRERFLVAHFWNPAYLAPLVEICRSPETSSDIVKTTMEVISEIGNKPVLIRKEIPGFLGNRIMHAMNREALALIGKGVCDAEDIDKVVLSSFGPRFANLGPMEYLDFSGLDLIRNIQGYLYGDLDTTPGVLPVIERLTGEGKLGIKTGKGLFDWSVKENRIRENRDREFIRKLKSGLK